MKMSCAKYVSRPCVELQAEPMNASDFKSKAVFDQIERNMEKRGPEFVRKIRGIYNFTATRGEQEVTWIVDFLNGKGSITIDPSGKGARDEACRSDLFITMQDEDLLKLVMGQLDPQQAYKQGMMKIRGNLGLAVKLRELRPIVTKTKL